jgi:hypothetical protein
MITHRQSKCWGEKLTMPCACIARKKARITDASLYEYRFKTKG